MRVFDRKRHLQKKEEIMQKCFDCYAEHGLGNVGLRAIGKACGVASGSLYTYFEDMDDLIVQSTAYVMSKVEDDFMAITPTSVEDAMRFIDEVPYWTAQKHGEKYRLMYQVYTNPKYINEGKKFFDGVNERYTEYAKMLEPKIGIPHEMITPLIFI